ncbi:hypothetical protein FRC17_003737 [Serendipita sp. 399]|nr:hypothetical protein FRC17_003737 [Serendipita sp. 399]
MNTRPINAGITQENRTGELAIQVVKLQLQVYNQNLHTASQTTIDSTNPKPGSAEAAALKIAESLGDDPEEERNVIEKVSSLSIAQSLCTIPNISYSVFCNVRTHMGSMEPKRKRGNIFVAGGLVLGALLCVDAREAINKPQQWESSDVDIYIYGLTPSQANAKIRHLYDIFKRNLPATAPILVVRNSKTITFMSNYPRRRFQIILKFCSSPAEVLLNFDLDICAVGYDGAQVYMLPRAARALETGYNVFTMDMVQGHYLGTRRASQEQRLVYARKGYGIRILPSYITALKSVDVKELPLRGFHPYDPENLDIDSQVEKARDYFNKVFRTILSLSNGGRNLQRTYAGTGYRSLFTGTSKDIRTPEQKRDRVPIFTHALFDTLGQNSNEPLGRSCLTGFELFCRHVELFNAEAAGDCVIEPNVWASTTYEDVYYSSTYNDLPNYVWDDTFQIDAFREELDRFNQRQSDRLYSGWKALSKADQKVEKEPMVQRIVHGSTIDEVFKQDLVIMIWIPEDFVAFVQKVLAKVAKERELRFQKDILREVWKPEKAKIHARTVLYEVKIDMLKKQIRYGILKQQISRRALRSKTENEFLGFALWIARDPGPISGIEDGSMVGLWREAFYVPPEIYYDDGESDDEDAEIEGSDGWASRYSGSNKPYLSGIGYEWSGDEDEYSDDPYEEEPY